MKCQIRPRTYQTDKDCNNIESLPLECLSMIETPITTASQFNEGVMSCTHSSNNKDESSSLNGSQFCTIPLVNVASKFKKVQTGHCNSTPWVKGTNELLISGVNYVMKTMDNAVVKH